MANRWRMLWLRALRGPLLGLFCKLRIEGRKQLPAQGGALLVADIASAVDAVLLQAALGRPIAFVVSDGIDGHPWTACIARQLDMLPIAADAPPEDFAQFAEELRGRIAEGALVCVTQEALLAPGSTRVPWYGDYGSIAGDAPVLPVHFDRLWELYYTFDDGVLEFAKKRRLRFRQPVSVCIGAPVENRDGATVRGAIADCAHAWRMRRPTLFPSLRRAFIVSARRNLLRPCVGDSLIGSLSYFKTLVGSIVFARKLRPLIGDRHMVGVLLPTTVGGALTNLALHLLGRAPINLNYTLDNSVVAQCAARCELTHVITSRKFLEKVPVTPPGEVIFLEDVKASVAGGDRIRAMLAALCLPARALERSLGAGPGAPDDIATVIFSSGSESTPKGIVLTERNIMCNLESLMEILPRHRETSFVGFLPLFHSFGYVVTLWLPIVAGVSAVYHPNPLEPRIIGDLVKKYKATFMCGTSTFLQAFARRCTVEQLKTIEFVVTGAEKLAPGVRDAFRDKFGVEPLEGYGTTECAPAVAVNLPDLESPGYYVEAFREGSIGKPIPGVIVRVVDPETRALRPGGEAGMLEVRGPNIMRGYLGMEEKTARVLREGWYETGDIARVDEDGFIFITGRLARFSKIAGEMVPHGRIEEALHAVMNFAEQRMAVSSVPDKAKGERIVVLHTLDDDEREAVVTRISEAGLPNLWQPKSNAFYRIEAIPVLGTGKLDIQGVKRLAEELAGAE